MKTLQPGAVIGILGGGQLGRMLAMAAAQLGYHTHIYCPDDNNPAEQVTDRLSRKAYDDQEALAEFASQVDVITYEFENIPVETVEALVETTPVFPSSTVLKVSQDRLSEKDFLNDNGIPTAPYLAVDSLDNLRQATDKLGIPAVLKTRRFGYDGKGQVVIKSADQLEQAFNDLGGKQLILEGFIPFTMEISVLVGRGQDGQIKTFVPVENQHKNHILDVSIAPANIQADIAEQATESAKKIVEALDYVGLLAVEYFVSADEPKLRVNEIAPRVHNSGHWTIEACPTSQFEQHIRAVSGLALGDTSLYGRAVMTNLIGDDILKYEELLRDAGANVHHYGKANARPGRKMGHVTRIYPLD